MAGNLHRLQKLPHISSSSSISMRSIAAGAVKENKEPGECSAVKVRKWSRVGATPHN